MPVFKSCFLSYLYNQRASLFLVEKKHVSQLKQSPKIFDDMEIRSALQTVDSPTDPTSFLS